jgi:hypothetical protein
MAITVRIRLKLRGTMGETYYLDADSDDWGVMRYSHCGRIGGIPHALSNMQMKKELPHTCDDFKGAKDMIPAIIQAVESGVYDVESVVYAKTRRAAA